jgi:Fic family protein
MRPARPPKPSRDYIWQRPGWPQLEHDAAAVASAIAATRRAQGAAEGQLAAIGLVRQQELAADAWTQEALSTAAIEGERLDLETVRSSVARRLGVMPTADRAVPRAVDGLLDVMEDAVARASEPLTHQRLHAWQAALFPTGYSGITRILVGGYREHAEPMQIVGGRIGRETVYYEAPTSARVQAEMDQFLAWLSRPAQSQIDSLLQAAQAHLWFETIHPYEDGNGRIGRAIVDWVLAREAGPASRMLRLSQQLLAQRKAYYAQLEQAQHGPLDITPWLVWFIDQIRSAFEATSAVISQSLDKAQFWNEHRSKDLNPRQRKAINLLLDAGPGGFEGGLSTRKYENLTGAARATASRDLIELAGMGLLRQVGAGRSTRYELRAESAAVQ